MAVKYLYIVILFFSSYTPVFSQDTTNIEIENLRNKRKISNGNNKVRILNKLADAYLDVSLEKSIIYSRQALKNSIENNSDFFIF